MPRVLALESPYADPSVEKECLPQFDVRRVSRAELPDHDEDVVGHAAFYSIEAEFAIHRRACLRLERALQEVVGAPR